MDKVSFVISVLSGKTSDAECQAFPLDEYYTRQKLLWHWNELSRIFNSDVTAVIRRSIMQRELKRFGLSCIFFFVSPSFWWQIAKLKTTRKPFGFMQSCFFFCRGMKKKMLYFFKY